MVEANRERIDITELRSTIFDSSQQPEWVEIQGKLKKTGQILNVTAKGKVVGEFGPNTTTEAINVLIFSHHPLFKGIIPAVDEDTNKANA
jgi:hypothetical protein